MAHENPFSSRSMGLSVSEGTTDYSLSIFLFLLYLTKQLSHLLLSLFYCQSFSLSLYFCLPFPILSSPPPVGQPPFFGFLTKDKKKIFVDIKMVIKWCDLKLIFIEINVNV